MMHTTGKHVMDNSALCALHSDVMKWRGQMCATIRMTLSKKITHTLILISIVLFAALPANAFEVTGKASIIDGDTIDVNGQRIRLHGIDAAETGQRCVNSSRKIVRPSDIAIERLTELTKTEVTCKGSEYDPYGRLIAICVNRDGIIVNRQLVHEGLAWAYIKFSNDYVAEEAEAQRNLLGIWQLACERPEDFRRKRWDVAIQKAPNGCPIKGNISLNGRIYHTPWSRHYAATKIDTSKGERWFCSEKEAIDAGWRLPIH